MKSFLHLSFVALLLVLGYSAGHVFPLTSLSGKSQESPALDISLAGEVWDLVHDSYLKADDLDASQVKYGLARGLMSVLNDPYSSFLDPSESASFMASLRGDLQGIGAELKLVDGDVVVVTPLPNSPAERGGLLPGDIIVKVDGVSLGLVTDLYEVVSKIRGPKDTSLTLTVLHADAMSTVDLTFVREDIHLDAVTYKELENEGRVVPVITLLSFTETIGAEFSDVLQKVLDAGHEELIMDMRFNGGGYLDGALSVLSHFVDEDKVLVITRNKYEEIERASHSTSPLFSGKLVVLVNDSSASASEIVAGALQDYDRAHLIGVKTFGKGTVQEVVTLQDSSTVRITVAEWLTPLRRVIDGEGVVPDELVDLDFEDYRNGNDLQMQAALKYLLQSKLK